ncbi:Hypothetical protein Cul05146_0504 [Corynebacterium ulcerans]|uniref:Uncharacterized protein n=1 Tax=Corynebacterium ulcerans FRC58 TaxID=1408268 RepID=A0ABN4GXA9_CORUL|nr:Hypothetical protein Cul05146_0504 [Corynebacterium ulcerans]AKN76387.1 Hypothetical protein CulFRC58_0533 [Corynebacterium ulcerans FRC58]
MIPYISGMSQTCQWAGANSKYEGAFLIVKARSKQGMDEDGRGRKFWKESSILSRILAKAKVDN